MEKINDRILKVFNSLDIKQFEFANRIGVSQSHISKLFKEDSDKNPSERIIKLICLEFNVNEEWLRTGKGEMFIQLDTFSLDEYAKQNKLTSLELDIVKAYISLDSNIRKDIMNSLKSIFDAHSEVAATKDDEIAVVKDEDDDIEKELESYRLELEAEKRGKTLSVSRSTESKNIG